MPAGTLLQFEVHLVAPDAAANHLRPRRVGRRLERDLLVLERFAGRLEILRLRAGLPLVAVDGHRRSVEIDRAKESRVGRDDPRQSVQAKQRSEKDFRVSSHGQR